MTRRPSPSFSLRCGLFLLLVTSSLVLTYLVLRPLAVAGTVPSPIYQYLDLNGEQNLIAWWNSGLLLLIAILSVLSAAAAPLARERLGFVVVALPGPT